MAFTLYKKEFFQRPQAYGFTCAPNPEIVSNISQTARAKRKRAKHHGVLPFEKRFLRSFEIYFSPG